MNDGNTPEGTALSPDEGRTKLAALLSTPPQEEQAEQPEREETPVEAEAEHPEPDEATESEEAPSSEDDADEGEPSQDETESEPTRYRLPDGTEVTADEVEEWRKGHLRQSDYTRKAQELAEKRKATEEREAHIAQQAQYFDQTMPIVMQIAQSRIPPAPDPKLMDTDLVGYMQQKEAHDAAMREVQELQGAYDYRQQQIQQEQARVQQEQMQNAQAELVRMMPELKDPAKVKALRTEFETALPNYGYTAEDVNHLTDPRQVSILKKAIAYDKLMANKPKAIDKAKDAPPVQKPGRRSSPKEAHAKARQEQMAKLRKTGSRHDGQAMLRQMLESDGG